MAASRVQPWEKRPAAAGSRSEEFVPRVGDSKTHAPSSYEPGLNRYAERVPPRPYRRPRILGFGPVGYALLVPLAALIWVAWTGHDLRHDLLRLITAALGPRALYAFVSRGLTGHFFSLYTPQFGLTSLAVALLVLHFAPRPIGALRYGALVAWSLVEPVLIWVLPHPAWLSGPAWSASPTMAMGTAAGCGSALCLWYVTGSRAVAVATIGAVLILYPAGETFLVRSMPPNGLLAVLLWHLAVAAILAFWVVRQWRSIKPDHACQSCGYDLRGLTAPRCPECGASVPTS